MREVTLSVVTFDKEAIVKLLKKNCCYVLLLVLAVSTVHCNDEGTNPKTTINMDPFIAMAKASGCSDQSNKLYTIDNSMVFWGVSGSNCPDHSYKLVLFGADTGKVYCKKNDSYGGPVEFVNDSTYLVLFHTIITNQSDDKLGLDLTHSVVNVKF